MWSTALGSPRPHPVEEDGHLSKTDDQRVEGGMRVEQGEWGGGYG